MATRAQQRTYSLQTASKQVAPGVLVVDGDGHVLETEETFAKYIEPEFKAQCPRLVRPYADADTFFLIDGVLIPDSLWLFRGTYPLGYGALAFRYAGRGEKDSHEPGQVDAAGLSINRRLRDMAVEGRDIDVLFPSILLGGSGSNQYRNLPLVSAVCRAYNNWLADYCSVASERLKRVAVTCLHDIEAATREVNRCVTELGCVAAMIAPANPNEKTLDDPYFYPLYEECQRLDIPICLHISLQRHPDNLQRIVHRDFSLTFALVSLPHIIALGQLIFGGVLDRFPKLRWALLEAGVGWVPYFIERFDDKYKPMLEIFGEKGKTLEKLPSEYARSEQLFFSCDPDEAALPLAVEVLGEERIIYASDYPHHDAKFPNSVRIIWEHPKLSESAKQKILGENALRLYKLPV
ncbi:MAG: amidohydrolase [Deltaproteobacteria bacterium]|nr:amidohydrolase [Deltaproteobacteria bacterium]